MSTTSVRRKAKPLDIPNINEDPGERKRILNVLAQRRYRRRKKEHLQHLERAVSHSDSADGESTGQDLRPNAISVDQFEQAFPSNEPTDFDFTLNTDPLQTGTWAMSCLDPTTLEAFDYSQTFALPSLPTSPSASRSSLSPSSSSGVAFSRDELHLPVLELNLLRGAMEIAKRLEVDSLIWSFNAISPFCDSTRGSDYSHLPLNLRPTVVQRRLPHHPVFDILPWPSVRDKLIMVFSQPADIRPPNARSPTAFLDFVYDLEDSAEGVRIWGDDPHSADNWEVGEKLFANWWWALNSDVVNRANEIRSQRGAKLLGVQRHFEEIE